MDCSTPGYPVLHYLLEFAQTHVHWVGDAIQPFHPLPPLSPPALNLSQHWGLFHWVSSSHQVAKGLELQLQHQSFQWIFLPTSQWSPTILITAALEVSPAPHPRVRTGGADSANSRGTQNTKQTLANGDSGVLCYCNLTHQIDADTILSNLSDSLRRVGKNDPSFWSKH